LENAKIGNLGLFTKSFLRLVIEELQCWKVAMLEGCNVGRLEGWKVGNERMNDFAVGQAGRKRMVLKISPYGRDDKKRKR